MKPMADMVETMQRQRYLLGNLCHGETEWLPQFREPSAGEVIEVWDCGQDGTPLTMQQAVTLRMEVNE